MVGFNVFSDVGLVHSRDLSGKRMRFEGVASQPVSQQMLALKPAIKKDSIHFSGAPDKGVGGNSTQDAGKLAGTPQKLAPRIYMDTPKNSKVSPRPSSQSRGPVDEMVKDRVRPFKLDNEPFKHYLSEHYHEVAEPYAEQLAEVASRYYRNNAVLQVSDDELKDTILALMKRKMGEGQQVKYLDGSSFSLKGLEAHYNSNRPLMHFFKEPADFLLAPKDKPVLWLVDKATTETAEGLQIKEVLQYIHAHNPNFRFLFTQPKSLPAKAPSWSYQPASTPPFKRSAQFQVIAVDPLSADQWVQVLQKHPQAQAILKHYGLTFPEKPLKQFMEYLLKQQDPLQPLERESVVAELDSLGSFIRTRQKDKTPEVTEDLVHRYFQKEDEPVLEETSPVAAITSDPMSQKPYKVIKPEKIKTRMTDVVGHERAKKVLSTALEIVEFPELYRDWNKGDEDAGNNYVLLMGEPGNGKTMLAKAIAAEGKGTFISTSGSQFVNAYVGMGANNMRQLEQEINALPEDELAVLFIEEIDGFSGKREPGSSGKEDHKTLNQLLVMTEGMESAGRKLLLIATTNVPGAMDDAMMSRFHYKIDILKPDKKQRKEILEKQLAQKQLIPDSSVDLEDLARRTDGFPGRDMRNIMKLAKLNLLSSIPRETKLRLNQDPEARKAFQLEISQKQLTAAMEEVKKGWKDVSKGTAMSDDVARSYF